MVKKTWSIVALLVVVGLSGCSGLDSIMSTEGLINANEQTLISDTQKLHDADRSSSIVSIHPTDFWVGKKTIQRKDYDDYRLDCHVELNESRDISITELGDKIQQICGVSINVDKTEEALSVSLPSQQIVINWSGPLRGLLDEITAQTGYSWKLNDHHRVIFFYFNTKTFQVYALPVTDSVSLGLTSSDAGSQSDSGSGGDSKSISVSSSLQSMVLNDIEKSVRSMMSGYGKLSLSASTAALTVTDTAAIVNNIAKYIEDQNKLLTTQVLLNVKVFNVDFKRDDQYAIDWNAAIKGTQGAINWVSNSAVSSPVNGTVNVLRGDLDASAFIKALSSQGKVSILTQPSITTLNLQAAPMEVVTEQSYVASISNSLVQNVGSQTAIVPGTLNTGFSMGLLPYVMNNNQLLLQYAVSLSDLKNITSFSSGSEESKSMVQLPEISRRSFNQKVKLRSGETLILSGFEQGHMSSKMDGVASPSNHWLGGGRQASSTHSVLVVMITPVVMP